MSQPTVIIGAGIIGLSTAYYLSQDPLCSDPSNIHLVDSSPELFAAASGNAAGFLSKDWFHPDLCPLGQLSFDLHREFASRHGGRERWGFNRSISSSYVPADYDDGSAKRKERPEDWLREGVSRAEAAAGEEFEKGDAPAWLKAAEGQQVDILNKEDTTANLYVFTSLEETC